MELLTQFVMYEHKAAERERELNDRLLVLLFRLSGPVHSDTAEDGSSKAPEQPGVRDPVKSLEADVAIRHYQ